MTLSDPIDLSQITGKYFGRETYENEIFAAWR